jgi:thymidylate synthase (FAD)
MVELLYVFGDDLMVANCARVSYAKEASNYTEEQNAKLINFLAREKHIAPFFHPRVQFRITCPIYVERQLTKTSVGVNLNQELDVEINSISGRYVDFSDSYTTIKEWRKQSKSSKQGSEGLIGDQLQAKNIEESVITTCKHFYNKLIELGVSKEQARTILPLNLNTTFIWTGSLYALLRLCQLRLKPDSQAETRELVHEMLDAVIHAEGNPFKHTLDAFGLNIISVSQWENIQKNNL